MRLLVDICQLLVFLAVSPLLAYRAMTTGKYRRDWDQRRGYMPVLPPPGPESPRVWMHAVSVGEVNAVRGLVTAWHKASPGTEFVISATTDTGIDRARQLFPDLAVIRYPLDFSRFVGRALDRIRPSLIVLVELEVWHQFVTVARDRGVPVAVVNGRLTEKSARLFGWVRPIARRMFGALTWVGAQDESYAERFRRVGVPAERVGVTGSVKWDTADIADAIPGSDALAAAMEIDRGRPLWVCGSTGPGEEAIILNAFGAVREQYPNLQLAIVPRKPERFDEVAELIQAAGYACIRRTQHPDVPPQTPPRKAGEWSAPAVQLLDTMGELRKLYCLADVVFVGRSLASMGGSDAMEVAAIGKPVVVGPHNENFTDVVQRLVAGRALTILSADAEQPEQAARELAAEVGRLLADPAGAREMGRRGREVVRQNRGATERTLEHLRKLMPVTVGEKVTSTEYRVKN